MVPFRPEDETRGILTAIGDASDDAIIGADLDGVIRFWNRAAERLYGYTAQEVTGRPVSLFEMQDLEELLVQACASRPRFRSDAPIQTD